MPERGQPEPFGISDKLPAYRRDPRYPVIGRGQVETASADVAAIVPPYDRPRRKREREAVEVAIENA